MKITFAPVVALLAAAILASCKKNDSGNNKEPLPECSVTDTSSYTPPTLNDGRRFSIARFEASIRSQLDGQCVGYQWALSSGGRQVRASAGGMSRIDGEGAEAMRPCQRMNIASVSKTLTAVATLKLMGYKGLTIDSPIARWLPPDWMRGPGIDTITFGQLLTHRTALRSVNNNWDVLRYEGLRTMISQGTDTPAGYLNANLALCRILITELQGDVARLVTEDECAHNYQDYVNKYVLSPAGVANAGFITAAGDRPTHVYRTTGGTATTSAGGYNPDVDGWYLRSGGGGWMLSAIDLNKVQIALRYTESILSNTQSGILFGNMLGLADSPYLGFFGQAYGGNGGIVYGTGQGYTAVIYFFPYGVEASLLINSLRDPGGRNQPPTFPFAPTVLQNAYSAAWQ